jgi:biopolymer transport protein ExbB/TolQ
MNDARPIEGIQHNRLKRAGIYAALSLALFLIGFIPMWLTARSRAAELYQTQGQLRLARMQNGLASAAIDARRAEYESARQAASRFFTESHAEIARGEGSALSQAQRDQLQLLLAPRDEIITLLARSDPVSADRLVEMYVSFRKSM